MANTWNKSGTTWGYNSWQSDTVKPTITGQAATASVGSLTAYNEAGWGSDGWGVENWGQSGLTVSPTGLGMTMSLGTAIGEVNVGWGRDTGS